jgi:hypothetical protein
MANLLPADKAAEQLFKAVEHYKGVVLVVGTVLRDGKKKPPARADGPTRKRLLQGLQCPVGAGTGAEVT